MKTLMYAVFTFVVARFVAFVVTDRNIQLRLQAASPIDVIIVVLLSIVVVLTIALFVGIPVFAWRENKKNGFGFWPNLERLMSSED